jgi:transcriptional regulator with XRE-family HTH domain
MLSDDKILKKFAKRVKKLRIEKGDTQIDAYNETGIHFGRIEQGNRDVSLTTIVKIADYFKISVGELVD